MATITTTTNLGSMNLPEQDTVSCLNCVQPCSSISRAKFKDDDGTEKIDTTITTRIDIMSVLASIFKLDHLPTFNLDELKNGLGLCGDCARVLVPLIPLYDQFNQLRQPHSYLSKSIRELDELIFDLRTPPSQKQVRNHHVTHDNFDNCESAAVFDVECVIEAKQPKEENYSDDVHSTEELSDDSGPSSNSILKYDSVPSSSTGGRHDSPLKISKSMDPAVKLDRLTESEIVLARLGTGETRGQGGEIAGECFKVENDSDQDNVDDSEDNSLSSSSDDENESKKVYRRRRHRDNDTTTTVKEKDDEGEPYCCSLCQLSFQHEKLFHNHLFKVHSVKPFDCLSCSLSFRLPNSLRKHLRKVHHHCPQKLSIPSALQFRCKKCHQFFPTLNDLETHGLSSCQAVKRTRKTEASACPICQKKCRNLDHHQKTTHESSQCNFCEKWYAGSKNLRLHQEFKHAIELGLPIPDPEPCPMCPKIFKRKVDIERHLREVHNDAKKCVCDFCGKGFAKLDSLNRHILIHTNERPHECPDCHKMFRHLASLRVHQGRMHNDAVYLCSLCGQQFNAKSTLRRHALVHTDDRPFGCTLCQKRFKCSRDLKQHMRQRGVHSKINKTMTITTTTE